MMCVCGFFVVSKNTWERKFFFVCMRILKLTLNQVKRPSVHPSVRSNDRMKKKLISISLLLLYSFYYAFFPSFTLFLNKIEDHSTMQRCFWTKPTTTTTIENEKMKHSLTHTNMISTKKNVHDKYLSSHFLHLVLLNKSRRW